MSTFNVERSLLIVEDERRSGGWLSRFLRHAGFHCYNAESASAGIELLEKEKIEVVVGNIELLDMDFTCFVHTVKSRKPNVAVIFLTEHGSIYQAVKAIRSGALNYLVLGRDYDALLPALFEAGELVLSNE